MDPKKFEHLETYFKRGLESIQHDIEDLENVRDRYRKAKCAIGHLRMGYQPTNFGNTDEYRTMFVESFEIDGNGSLLSLKCLVVEDVLMSRKMHKPFPNDDGSQTMIAVDVQAPEIADSLIELYQEGLVTRGNLSQAMVQRRVCGKDAVIFCKHWFDWDYNTQQITLGALCFFCNCVVEFYSGDHLPTGSPHPILPPK